MDILIIKLSPVETITSSMYRTLAIARGLVECGNEVDMIVAPYNGLNPKDRPKDFLDDINVIRTNKNNTYTSIVNQGKGEGVRKKAVNVLKKVWHKLSVYDYTYSIAKKIDISILHKRNYDIVISSSDPKSSHIAVKMLTKQGLKYNRWIQYWGDPLTIDITRVDIWPSFIMKNIENRILSNADKIVYVSPFTLKEQKRLFPQKASKMSFLPVSYMSEEIYEKTRNERFTIGYYGNYEKRVRNIVPFYEACCNLGSKIAVSIYGDTDISLKSTDNIQILPRSVIDEHKKSADLLVCILNSSGTQIPGKLYHLAGTNKKVLVIVDGDNTIEMKAYLESFSRFYLCENNAECIKDTIDKIINDDSEFLPVESLKYDYISRKFIE